MTLRLGIRPVWPRDYVPDQPDADLYFDFTRSRFRLNGVSAREFTPAKIAGLSVSRAHTNLASAYAQTTAGLWLPFAANVPRRTDRGLLTEQARTNLCTNYNIAPAATTNLTALNGAAISVVAVDDLPSAAKAALAASELSQAGVTAVIKVECDGSAGYQGVLISGQLPALTQGSMSAFVHVESGAPPTLALMGASDAAAGAVVAGTAFTRSKSQGVTNTASSVMGLATRASTPAATTFYFIGNQLEAGATCSSLMRVDGASATRGADNISVSGLSVATPVTLVTVSAPIIAVHTLQYMARLDDGTASNHLTQYINSGGARNTTSVSAGGVSQADMAGAPNSAAAGVTQTVASRYATNDIQQASNGVLAAGDTSATMPAGLTTLRIGSGVAGASPANAYFHQLRLHLRAFSNAELQAA